MSDKQTEGWVKVLRPEKQDASADCAPAAGSAITDADRINRMEAHPLPMEVRGGNEDGHTGTAWATAAHSGTLREAIDAMILSPNEKADLPTPGE